jgi:hypothetical protein
MTDFLFSLFLIPHYLFQEFRVIKKIMDKVFFRQRRALTALIGESYLVPSCAVLCHLWTAFINHKIKKGIKRL